VLHAGIFIVYNVRRDANYKDPGVTVRKSKDCGNKHKTACTKTEIEKKNGYDANMAALTSLISGTDQTFGQEP
jgi:hypothetical protein